eukprot:CAMPEP_0183305562 /NCGR_PEP_ID=MMETSP0160_2-20130417/10260_1 /TAXON_ID=2839 ORGANISM="Odontella Sinensis, Strain Grunow 1884" /NCGR_SAMPLE_ID=MMETSP0160_2 /ASSEMBLY_ACC=CAM_ASM_000250 /LENGTH=64 /DNA_ID=CAMNT_0025468777 /DNA_START=161 /DNA_END=355 /DNA_ORIENTATION=-
MTSNLGVNLSALDLKDRSKDRSESGNKSNDSKTTKELYLPSTLDRPGKITLRPRFRAQCAYLLR